MTDDHLTCAAWLRAGKTRYKGPMSRFMPPLAVLRACAWFCVGLIAFLSLMPREMEARTGLPGEVEHLIAYADTAGLLRLGYLSWAGWRIAAALFVYSGAGAILGAIAATLIGRRTQQKAN